jgi:hypothetical protein
MTHHPLATKKVKIKGNNEILGKKKWRNNTQHNDTQRNDTQPNNKKHDTQRYDERVNVAYAK